MRPNGWLSSMNRTKMENSFSMCSTMEANTNSPLSNWQPVYWISWNLHCITIRSTQLAQMWSFLYPPTTLSRNARRCWMHAAQQRSHSKDSSMRAPQSPPATDCSVRQIWSWRILATFFSLTSDIQRHPPSLVPSLKRKHRLWRRWMIVASVLETWIGQCMSTIVNSSSSNREDFLPRSRRRPSSASWKPSRNRGRFWVPIRIRSSIVSTWWKIWTSTTLSKERSTRNCYNQFWNASLRSSSSWPGRCRTSNSSSIQ